MISTVSFRQTEHVKRVEEILTKDRDMFFASTQSSNMLYLLKYLEIVFSIQIDRAKFSAFCNRVLCPEQYFQRLMRFIVPNLLKNFMLYEHPSSKLLFSSIGYFFI